MPRSIYATKFLSILFVLLASALKFYFTFVVIISGTQYAVEEQICREKKLTAYYFYSIHFIKEIMAEMNASANLRVFST